MRRYEEDVDVRVSTGAGTGTGSAGEAPEQFIWHGRLYLVRSVQSRWTESRPWWQTSRVAPADSDDGEPGDGSAAGVGGVAVLTDAEYQVWRVEAAVGARGNPVVVDLSRDDATGRWRLLRAMD